MISTAIGAGWSAFASAHKKRETPRGDSGSGGAAARTAFKLGAPFRVIVRMTDPLMRSLIVVTANYNPDTKLWSAASADVGGLFLQTTSWKALVDAVPAEIDRVCPPGLFRPRRDIAIEVGAFGRKN